MSGGGRYRRLGGNVVQEGVERLLRDDSEGDEVLAESAAVAGLALEGFGYVVGSDEFGLDEQISQLQSRGDDILLEGGLRFRIDGRRAMERHGKPGANGGAVPRNPVADQGSIVVIIM